MGRVNSYQELCGKGDGGLDESKVHQIFLVRMATL